MPSHTPGTWECREIEELGIGIQYVVMQSDESADKFQGKPYPEAIALMCGTVTEHGARQLANARLMAASPEMAEALKAVDDDLKSYWLSDATKAKIDAALRKAGV